MLSLSPDIINGCFELVGALFTWRNAWQLHKDKKISGVYWPMTFFMMCWGFSNLFYYPSLNQWCSFWGGVVLMLGNAAWLLQLLLIKKRTDTSKCVNCGAPWKWTSLAKHHRHGQLCNDCLDEENFENATR